MRRREFIAGLGSTAAWTSVARGPQDRVRRIGGLSVLPPDDQVTKSQSEALLQGLAQLGWTDGRNVRIDYRWGFGNADNIRKSATELAILAPDVILANGGANLVRPLLQATRTVPIVFA